MLSTKDYLRGYKALESLRLKYYAGDFEGHRISRATKFEAKVILSNPSLDRDSLINASLAWLTEGVKGVEVYERILGRPYTDEERSRLTKELDIVAGLDCPIHGCIMCGIEDALRPEIAQEINNALDFLPLGYLRWGFLPAVIAAELVPRDLELLIRDGRVADAKISTVSLSGMMERELITT